MKNASSILSHISYQPQFKSIRKHICYRKFIKLLQPKFQKAIAFVYVKNSTLFVALSHPGYKMELNYNRDLLKSILNMISDNDKECKDMRVGSVVVFNSKYHKLTSKEDIKTDPKYTELSTAEFTIESSDRDIIDRFEAIKKQILNNRR